MSSRSRTALLLLAAPAAVLGGAYLWLAASHGSLRLWDVVVHESGRHTFGETLFYFEHFLRELPTDVAKALFVVAAVREAGFDGSRAGPRVRLACAVAALGLVLTAFALAASEAGVSSAMRDLLQFRTRDDVSAYGSHWRFHWLSTIWFAAAASVVARTAAVIARDRPPARDPAHWRGAWAFFAGLTLVFGVSPDILTDMRYVGHQAREILTHGPVTCLLAVGCAIAVSPAQRNTASETTPGRAGWAVDLGWLRLVAFAGIPILLAVVGIAGRAMDHGQTSGGLPAMIGAHFVEHALDYVLVALLVVALTAGLKPCAAPVPSRCSAEL